MSRRLMNLGAEDFLVVHEGLKNNPDLKEKLVKIAQEILGVTTYEPRHLSDIGLILDFTAKELVEISKECFKRHKEEQKLKE